MTLLQSSADHLIGTVTTQISASHTNSSTRNAHDPWTDTQTPDAPLGYRQQTAMTHLAPDFSVFIGLDLGVVPALAHKVEAAHNIGVVAIASLHCTLHLQFRVCGYLVETYGWACL